MTLLQGLNISHNKIFSLPEAIKKCRSLEVVDISYNQLSIFPGDLALHLPHLQSFVFEGNPGHEAIDKSSKEIKSKRQKIR